MWSTGPCRGSPATQALRSSPGMFQAQNNNSDDLNSLGHFKTPTYYVTALTLPGRLIMNFTETIRKDRVETHRRAAVGSLYAATAGTGR